ncbi:serine protease [Streptomyces sp. NBC_00237]|uniref:S1 family peptidase n=1 Tax=Streptomyces sp. NBC_00237 TaxID=2975687 RepID=UPI002258855F|nr:serine protease [Streptomyces sp. NBC_00237]MCX5206675.1 serine protease [Streptomyces sp. NBC_00237]
MSILSKRSTAAVLTTGLLAALGTAAGVAPAAAIHGGKGTTVVDHPYVMSLQSAEGEAFCGGTLITPTKVLTAGHCVDEGLKPGGLRVVGGRTDLRTGKGTVAKVASIKIHPKYDVRTLTHDAAVVTLAKPMPYKTLPVAGPKDAALFDSGSPVTALGWGLTATSTPGVRLKSAALVLNPLAKCAPFTEPWETAANKLCGTPAEGTRNSICHGDSGGPLVSGGKLIGITSAGNSYCNDDFPFSIFTRSSAVTADLGVPAS